VNGILSAVAGNCDLQVPKGVKIIIYGMMPLLVELHIILLMMMTAMAIMDLDKSIKWMRVSIYIFVMTIGNCLLLISSGEFSTVARR
jgi:hypothetical protein